MGQLARLDLWEEVTLETSGEDVKLHSKRVRKIYLMLHLLYLSHHLLQLHLLMGTRV